MEKWKIIQNYENYEISTAGEVRSRLKLTLKSQRLTHKGYLRVDLYKYGKKKSFYTHRLVANAFLPKVEFKDQVNHKNGVKTNNYVDNLEWCNNSENMKHSFLIGINKRKVGEANNFSKLTEEQVILIRDRYKTESNYSKIAKLYGVTVTTIRDIVLRKTWKHL